MTGKTSANLNKLGRTDCSVCRDLLLNMERFFALFEGTRRFLVSDWLTVDDVASELKVSKSIVYRLIRSGELEAVDIVETNGRIAQKGHYRIRRSSLNQYLESRRVKSFPNESSHKTSSRHYPKVRNHLGL